MSQTAQRDHAVVIGAGMAGLTTATALAAAFERVTVLDRDRLPERAEHRGGVPQGRHVHVLLGAGAEALEELFPGLLADLVAGGAPTGDTDRFRMCVNGHRLARGRTGRHSVTASRPFVEAHVRDRVRHHPAITISGGCDVRGVVAGRDGRRVVGVRVGGPAEAAESTLPADLVVDCSGRRSPLPTWLGELGFPQPEVDELRIDLRYATCRYHGPSAADDLLVMVGPTPNRPRGGAMMQIEDGSWLVTLAGLGGEQPPLEPEGFEAFAARLASDDIHRAVVRGRALDTPSAFRFPAGVRRRYERLADFPDGLLVAGDAVCSFNPVYGQGMTVAALEAATLRHQLGEAGVPTADRWFAAVTPVVEGAWEVAVGADLALECVEGHRSVPTRLLNRYMTSLHAAAAHDPALSQQFLRVTGLLDPPAALLRPPTLARVLRGRLRGSPDTAEAATAGAR